MIPLASSDAAYAPICDNPEFLRGVLDAVFEAIPVHFHVVDDQYRLLALHSSPDLLTHLGLATRQDAIGQRCFQLYKARETPCPDCSVARCFASGRRESRNSTPEEDDLVGTPTKLFAAPVRDADGRIVAAIEIGVETADLARIRRELTAANDRLSELAQHDPLTRLFNRRDFDRRLHDEFAVSRRSRRPLSLLIIDVDRFKYINDRHGHAAGDATLSRLGQILSDFVRAADHASRIGGDEFCVILNDTTEAQARIAAERLLGRMATSRWPAEAVSVSIGAATVAPAAVYGISTPLLLFEAADAALYQAKKAGRGRCASAAPLH